MKFIIFFSLLFGLFTPNQNKTLVKFVEAKKVTNSTYDVIVAPISPETGKVVKDIVTKCDSVRTIKGYQTHIMREPNWCEYYELEQHPRDPELVRLVAITKESAIRKYNLKE